MSALTSASYFHLSKPQLSNPIVTELRSYSYRHATASCHPQRVGEKNKGCIAIALNTMPGTKSTDAEEVSDGCLDTKSDITQRNLVCRQRCRDHLRWPPTSQNPNFTKGSGKKPMKDTEEKQESQKNEKGEETRQQAGRTLEMPWNLAPGFFV